MSLRAPPFVTEEILGFVERVERAWQVSGFPAVRLTSWYRTRYENALVGGHPNSQHLTGLAIDVIPDGPGRTFGNAARSLGLVVVDEGDHLHLQRYAASAGRGLCCGAAVTQVR